MLNTLSIKTVSFRDMASEDEPFLYRLYASTRSGELSSLNWTEAEKEGFLELQFTAQHTYYLERFRGAQFQIILLRGEPIGRLYVDRRDEEIRVIDIALLPEHRGKGIGSSLLRNVLVEGANVDKPVRIHVERSNRALFLYERMGFTKIDDSGVYLLLEWTRKDEPCLSRASSPDISINASPFEAGSNRALSS